MVCVLHFYLCYFEAVEIRNKKSLMRSKSENVHAMRSPVKLHQFWIYFCLQKIAVDIFCFFDYNQGMHSCLGASSSNCMTERRSTMPQKPLSLHAQGPQTEGTCFLATCGLGKMWAKMSRIDQSWFVFAVLSRPSSPALGPGLSGGGGGGRYNGGHLVEEDPAVQFVTNCLSDDRCARQMRAEAGICSKLNFLS